MSNEELKILNHEMCYRLVLSDGRKANIHTEIVSSNIAGKSVAEFHSSARSTASERLRDWPRYSNSPLDFANRAD